MNIQEVCRIRKEELKITYQDISDISGVPLSTVQNYFLNCRKLHLFIPLLQSVKLLAFRSIRRVKS